MCVLYLHFVFCLPLSLHMNLALISDIQCARLSSLFIYCVPLIYSVCGNWDRSSLYVLFLFIKSVLTDARVYTIHMYSELTNALINSVVNLSMQSLIEKYDDDRNDISFHRIMLRLRADLHSKLQTHIILHIHFNRVRFLLFLAVFDSRFDIFSSSSLAHSFMQIKFVDWMIGFSDTYHIINMIPI